MTGWHNPAIVVVLSFECLYDVFYMCSSKCLGPQKSAALGAGICDSNK
jgi:hypothetical protein